MKPKYLPLLAVIAITTSCKKDKTTSDCDKTMEKIAGTYTVTKMEIGTGATYIEVTPELEDCQKDDKVLLNANGQSFYQDLGTKCDSDGSSTGSWSIDASGKMNIDDGGDLDITSADITSFDCTTLVLTTKEPGTDNHFRVTLKK